MPLTDVELVMAETELPDEIQEFIEEADSRINQYFENTTVRPADFVPSDFATVYRALRAIVDQSLTSHDVFCEWGSGFGVVASLAAMLEFDAYGIEFNRDLVDAARRLADDFALPVEFVHGSFIPPGGDELAEAAYAENNGELFSLVTNADNAYDELGVDAADFDLVFAYPWPGEEAAFAELFESFASDGALLLTYTEYCAVHLQRKSATRSMRSNASTT